MTTSGDVSLLASGRAVERKGNVELGMQFRYRRRREGPVEDRIRLDDFSLPRLDSDWERGD